MKYQFFAIPAQYPVESQQELNAFCGSHQVLQVEKAFVPDGPRSFWSVCVTWVDGYVAKPERPKSRIDYREILDEKDFAIYAELRTLRKNIAEKEGLPVYALFSNEQLAGMVTNRITTQAALRALNGVGKARLEKFGEAFLAVLRAAFPTKTGLSGQKENH